MTEQTERTPLLLNTNISVNPEVKDDLLKTPVKEEEFSFKSVSKRKKFILISMAFVNFCASCCFSLLGPFFPVEAGKKGVSQTVVGMIFGAFELIIFISSPIFGNYISQIGCKFMFVSGSMVCGSCAILFGLLDKCPDGIIFIIMCFACRSIEALGASAYVTSLFAILAHEFPDNVITVMGTLETFSGLGMMVGPPIGGALYQIGGYGLPFFVIGSTVIIIGTITSLYMPSIGSGSRMYSGSLLTLLRSPMVIFTLINIVAGSISLGFLDPTLANHLQQFNLKTWVVGMVFLIAPAVYALTAPIWGVIGDKKFSLKTWVFLISFAVYALTAPIWGVIGDKKTWVVGMVFLIAPAVYALTAPIWGVIGDKKTWVVGMMFLIAPAVYALTAPIWGVIGDKKGFVRLMIGSGSLAMVVPSFMLGPAPFVSSFIPNKLYINIIALAVLGLLIGVSLIPTFKALLIGANSLGLPNNLDTYGKASGFFNSAFSLGAFLGPTIGGAMVDKFGFDWATAGIGGLYVFAGVLMLLYMCIVKEIDIPPLSEEVSVTVEKTPDKMDTNINQSTDGTAYKPHENV